MSQQISRMIAEHGQYLQGVFPREDGDDHPFVYTIGNYELGLPELLLIGLPFPPAGAILNLLGATMRRRRKGFTHGELVPFGGPHPAKLVRPDERAARDFAIQAWRHYSVTPDRLAILQVLPPDLQGLYPGDPECQAPFCDWPNLSLILQ